MILLNDIDRLGMWHSINIGESEENLVIVFNDAIEWILKRS